MSVVGWVAIGAALGVLALGITLALCKISSMADKRTLEMYPPKDEDE